MKRYKAGYDELLEMIEKKFPDRVFLHPKEAATIIGCNIKTVYEAIEKKYKPLPAKNIGSGLKNKRYVIPITELISWAIGR